MERSKVAVVTLTVFSMFVHSSVSQVQMSISPSEVVLTTSTPPDTTFTCTISSSISMTAFYNLQIISKGETGTESVVMAHFVEKSLTLTDNAPQGSSVSGGFDTNTPTSTTLTLTRPTADIVCEDKGYYECKLTYLDADSNLIVLDNNQTLSIYALPSDVILEARKNGVLIQGTSTNNADVNVGDMVEFTCMANIGSINSTRIRWKRTSEIGTVDNFIIYNPPQGSYDDGTPSSGDADCTYSRTATMSYNVTSFDANRDNNLAFQCYISVVPPGQNEYETQNPPSFYINPVAANSGTPAGSTDDGAAGASVGSIVGGVIGGLVLIVLIVLLVYFLWYRKRGEGNDYKTKEETGGSNPNIVESVNNTYAVPHKDRKPKRGHQNDAMEDKHTSRHHERDDNDHMYYNNSRGRANYAMDDDNDDRYSRDGSPTINHMGVDPDNGSFGTGV